jgi:hypothetical protein
MTGLGISAPVARPVLGYAVAHLLNSVEGSSAAKGRNIRPQQLTSAFGTPPCCASDPVACTTAAAPVQRSPCCCDSRPGPSQVYVVRAKLAHWPVDVQKQPVEKMKWPSFNAMGDKGLAGRPA